MAEATCKKLGNLNDMGGLNFKKIRGVKKKHPENWRMGCKKLFQAKCLTPEEISWGCQRVFHAPFEHKKTHTVEGGLKT